MNKKCITREELSTIVSMYDNSKVNVAIVEIFGVDGSGKSYLDIYIIFKTFYAVFKYKGN